MQHKQPLPLVPESHCTQSLTCARLLAVAMVTDNTNWSVHCLAGPS